MTTRSVIVRRFAPTLMLAGLALAVTIPYAAAESPGCPALEPQSTIQVKMLQTIDSTKSTIGDEFNAEVVGEISPDGQVLADSTAPIRRASSSASRKTGSASTARPRIVRKLA